MRTARISLLKRLFFVFASSVLLVAAGQMDRVEAKLKEAVKLNPSSFEANYNLGELYLHAGKLPEGIPYMEKAQSLKPSDYVSGYDLALAYFETREYAKARRQIQAMLDRQDSAELHDLLADVEEAAGDYVKAADEYQRAARMEPSEEHIFDWGSELLNHRAWEAATEVFSTGIGLYPKSAKLNVGLGIALYSRGNYEPAIKALCSATDLDPSESWPYLFLGKMYKISSSSADEVSKRLARFVQLQPNNPQAQYYYALSLWNREQNSEAKLVEVESLLKKAVALDGRFSDAHLQLGILYGDQRRYPEAIHELERAIALQPALTTAHYHLAQAYMRTGEKSRADQEFHTFERLRQQDQVQTEKERNEIRQFIVTMKEQAPSPSAK